VLAFGGFFAVDSFLGWVTSLRERVAARRPAIGSAR
jgi:hypothetical protein